MSITAIALFSWSVTYAVRESAETVMYSGSRSCATVAFGPKTRISGLSSATVAPVGVEVAEVHRAHEVRPAPALSSTLPGLRPRGRRGGRLPAVPARSRRSLAARGR